MTWGQATSRARSLTHNSRARPDNSQEHRRQQESRWLSEDLSFTQKVREREAEELRRWRSPLAFNMHNDFEGLASHELFCATGEASRRVLADRAWAKQRRLRSMALRKRAEEQMARAVEDDELAAHEDEAAARLDLLLSQVQHAVSAQAMALRVRCRYSPIPHELSIRILASILPPVSDTVCRVALVNREFAVIVALGRSQRLLPSSNRCSVEAKATSGTSNSAAIESHATAEKLLASLQEGEEWRESLAQVLTQEVGRSLHDEAGMQKAGQGNHAEEVRQQTTTLTQEDAGSGECVFKTHEPDFHALQALAHGHEQHQTTLTQHENESGHQNALTQHEAPLTAFGGDLASSGYPS